MSNNVLPNANSHVAKDSEGLSMSTYKQSQPADPALGPIALEEQFLRHDDSVPAARGSDRTGGSKTGQSESTDSTVQGISAARDDNAMLP
ncbi:hypothetical protein PMIN01_03694 [Paraphaeosphaeria minitans]|uniref:Uncharacterized protein n=1 Tax=Paraphaeosphaeria minitans TaxID=565426 RepID=A0A9P6GML0_9PLEO|nr:hypothetical protein PMIN01_03694 [Paraphaeosphaeria minitans]